MTDTGKNSVQLEIYSDVICPWCYVGKARYDEALKLLDSKLSLQTSWKPFELNPSMPKEGADRKEYMTKKFGSSDMSAMQNRLSSAGAENGLKFNFAEMKRVPNTFNAHRLIWFAGTQGKQHELSEVLFRKYFHDAQDIGNTDVLVLAAEEAGIPANVAREFLQSDAGVDEVQKEEKEGRLLGIDAVPTFVLNGEIIASGAIPAEELASLIEKNAMANAN